MPSVAAFMPPSVLQNEEWFGFMREDFAMALMKVAWGLV